jgi:hypothetical protein
LAVKRFEVGLVHATANRAFQIGKTSAHRQDKFILKGFYEWLFYDPPGRRVVANHIRKIPGAKGAFLNIILDL